MNSKNYNLKTKNYTEGFTLIEILIYAALIIILIGGSILTINNIIRSSSQLNNVVALEEEANFIFKKLEWALSDSNEINSPTSGSSASSISVDKTNFNNNPIRFSLSSDNILIKVGGASEQILNSESININSLLFEHIAEENEKPAGIRTTINIEGVEHNSLIYLRK